MPMIACPDCKKEMSDAAPACPSCGRPNANAESPRSVGLLLGAGILFLPLIFSWFTLRRGYTTTTKAVAFVWLAFCLLIVGTHDTKNAGSLADASSSSSSAQVMQVGIQQLLADYKNNEVGADNKYKGNLIEVTGIISDVKKDILDNLYVTLGTGRAFEIPEVQAFFDDSMNNQLAGLNKGQQLTVVCRIDGLMLNVQAKDCVIK